MIDKELFKLIGNNKKYVFFAVLSQLIGLIANVGITASVCYALYLLTKNCDATKFVYSFIVAFVSVMVRYMCSRTTDNIKDKLGRTLK